VGLGLLLATLVLVTAGQSWASLLTQQGAARIDLTQVSITVGVTGVVTDSTAAFPNVSLPGYGYTTSIATNAGGILYASAEAGVDSATMFTSNGLYVGSASASQQVDFTAASAGSITLSILPTGFTATSSTTPGPFAYSASASAWLEIWNTSDFSANPEPTRISLLSGGPYSVSQNFALGDVGYYKIEVFADSSVEAVPEPSTTVLIGIGLAVVAFARRKMFVRS
jgi:hypothetical protein